MVQSSRSKAYFSEDFKLSVLKDMYENNLSVYSTAKKYGLKPAHVYLHGQRSILLTQNYYLCQMK